jgi:hypothetical protein
MKLEALAFMRLSSAYALLGICRKYGRNLSIRVFKHWNELLLEQLIVCDAMRCEEMNQL